MGKTSIVGLVQLLVSWLQLTFWSIHTSLDQTSFFQNIRLGRKVSFQDLSWFPKWPFLHYNEAEDTVICHSCMKIFKEKKNKTST